MSSSDGSLFVLLLVFLVIFVVGTIAMLAAIGKKGDERKRFIITKAGYNTYLLIIAALIFRIIRFIVGIFIQQYQDNRLYPFVLLTTITIVFFAQLIYLNRKHGN